MTSIPIHRNTSCDESEGYNAISLLSLMQKIMLNQLARNIRGESLGYVPHIYTNLPTN